MNQPSPTSGDGLTEDNTLSLEDAAMALIVLIARAHGHNLNNKISLLRFMLIDILEETPAVSSELQNDLQRLLNVVDSLYEDIEAANLETEAALQPVVVDKEIERIATEFSKRVRNFDFDWHCGAPGVIVNAPGLPYVLRELLWNFLKFAAPVAAGDERRRVSLRSSATGRPGWMRINVSGPGAESGMTEEFIQGMFHRGFSTDQRSGGEGLWLGRTLMNRAGGELTAHSSVPEGLHFTIDLPIASEHS